MAKKNDLNQVAGTMTGKLKIESNSFSGVITGKDGLTVKANETEKTEEIKENNSEFKSLVNEELNGVLTIDSESFSGTISSKEGITIEPMLSNLCLSEMEGLTLSTTGYLTGDGQSSDKKEYVQRSLENTSTQDLFVYKNVINDRMYNLNDVIQSRNPSTTVQERTEFNRLSTIREDINNIVLKRITESYE